MKKPLIGITAPPGTLEILLQKSYMRAYIAAVENAGGEAKLIPIGEYPPDPSALMKGMDGLLLSGGGDVDPARYGGEPYPHLQNVSAERDNLEFSLLANAIEKDIPFLGICRGCQVVNVAHGGTLYTDLPEQFGLAVNHSAPDSFPKDHLMHPIRSMPDFFPTQQLSQTEERVNSRHHQGIKVLGKGLEVMAVASDGLIEAVRLPGHSFGYAVQWHPENLPYDPFSIQLFHSFIQSAAQGCRHG